MCFRIKYSRMCRCCFMLLLLLLVPIRMTVGNHARVQTVLGHIIVMKVFRIPQIQVRKLSIVANRTLIIKRHILIVRQLQRLWLPCFFELQAFTLG